MHPNVLRPAKTGVGALRLVLACIVIALGAGGGAPTAHALDPSRNIRQYVHTHWATVEGAPANPHKLRQTPDGHLWMSSQDGVFRFDGIRFERMDAEIDPEIFGRPETMLVTRSGDVWVWYKGNSTFAIYRDGKFRPIPSPPAEGTVTSLVEAPDGAIWAGEGEIGTPVYRYFRGHWTRLEPTRGHKRDMLVSMVFTEDHAAWLSYYSGMVLRRAQGEASFRKVFDEPSGFPNLTLDRAGRVWVTGRKQILPLSGPGGRWPVPPSTVRYPVDLGPRGGRLLFDRDGNLWIADWGGGGLQRLRFTTKALPLEHFGKGDGLTSDNVSSILEDREGDIWVTTSLGLDRFRPADVVVEPRLTRPGTYGDILFSASDGRVYVGEADTVYRIDPHGSPEAIVTGAGQPTAMCEAHDGTLWIAFEDQLLSIGKHGRRRIEPPVTDSFVRECGFDRSGRLWVSVGRSGLFRREGERWVPLRAESSGPGDYYPLMMATDRSRDLWVQWGETTLARLDAAGPVKFSIGGYPGIHPIRHLYPGAAGPIITSAHGIAQLHDGKLLLALGKRMGSLRGATGLVQTPQGETWAITPPGVVRVMTQDLERAFRDPQFAPPLKVLGFQDGLPDRPIFLWWRSLVRGGDGRLWAATLGGTVWLDPARLHTNSIPPPVAITALTADGVRHRDPHTLTLPAGASNLSISYAALSLAIPERVHVRYRLKGYDRDWVDPGQRREAFYTDLPPGRYYFQVIAANNDGVWNRQGATLEFTIPPTFIQSIWFKLLCLLGLGLLAWGAYRLRLRQVTAQLQSRFEVRISERERIARELHDTLLQSIQGLMLSFRAAAAPLPTDHASRRAMDHALLRAEQALTEGRERVQGLRATDTPHDLSELFARVAEKLKPDPTFKVRVISEGKVRELHPFVREELGRIGEEAMFNTLRHAGAGMFAVSVTYGRDHLTVRFQDDGKGIDPALVQNGGRVGHFGIRGMRERAHRISGEFTLSSAAGAGAEIKVAVPAKVAYADSNGKGFSIIRRLARGH